MYIVEAAETRGKQKTLCRHTTGMESTQKSIHICFAMLIKVAPKYLFFVIIKHGVPLPKRHRMQHVIISVFCSPLVLQLRSLFMLPNFEMLLGFAPKFQRHQPATARRWMGAISLRDFKTYVHFLIIRLRHCCFGLLSPSGRSLLLIFILGWYGRS